LVVITETKTIEYFENRENETATEAMKRTAHTILFRLVRIGNNNASGILRGEGGKG